MKTLQILLLFLGFLLYNSPIESLKVNQIPNEQEAKKLNWSKDQYQAYLNSENKIEYLIYDYKYRKRKYDIPTALKSIISENKFGRRFVKVETKDGWLIGFDKGEWGGSLVWFDKKGTMSKKIMSGNIKGVFKIKNHFYIVEGLAHLGSSRGQVIKIKFDKSKWIIENKIELPEAPYSATLNKQNELLIITSKGLLKMNTGLEIEVLIEKGFWQYYLYPNSSVIKDNNLYVGMRGGILKLDLENIKHNQEWLTEKKL